MLLTQGQVYALAVASGMKSPKEMTAIAMAETKVKKNGKWYADTNAHNPNASTGDDSYGLWQVNMLGDMGPARRKQFGISDNRQLLNPFVNAAAAKKVAAGQGLGAWSTYGGKDYLMFMGQSGTAATQADWKPFEDWNDPFDLWNEDEWGPAPKSPWESLTGQTPPESLDSATDTVKQVERLGDILAKAGDWLSNPQSWIRIAYVIGGAALAIGGLVLIGRPLIEAAAASTPAGTIGKFAKGAAK